MIVFLGKDDSFSQFLESIKHDIENHQAVFTANSLEEISDLNENELLISARDFKNVENVHLKNVHEIYLVYSNASELDEEKITKHKANINIFDLNVNLNKKLILNNIKTNRIKTEENKNLKSQLLSLAGRLENTLETFESELIKIKKIYKTMVPMRQSSYKGLDFMSKFFTGEASGGEFFDIVENKNYLILGASFANSYLLSSCFMTHFQIMKGKKEIAHSDIEELKKNLKVEFDVIQESSNKTLEFEYLILEIDLKTLEVRYHNNGNYSLYSTNDLVIAPAQQESSVTALSRGQKYILVSPGLIKNWSHYGIEELVFDVIKKNKQLENSEFIDELSLLLKSNSSGPFLKNDASIITIEVSENVIHSI